MKRLCADFLPLVHTAAGRLAAPVRHYAIIEYNMSEPRQSKRVSPSGWTEKIIPVVLVILVLTLLAVVIILALALLGIFPSVV
jgi:hypothetical protein